MYVLLCLQLWGTTTSFILQGTLKLHAHLLVLLLRLAGLAQVSLDDFTQGRLIPRLCSASCVRIPVYVIFFALTAEAFQRLLPVSDTYTRLSTTVVYVVGAMTPAKSTMLLLSLTDNHVIDAWVHMPPERFCPYSLLSGTPIGTTNRTSFLVFLRDYTNHTRLSL